MSAKVLKFVRSVNGVPVEQRCSDGYVNATAMSKAHQKDTGQRRDVGEWLGNIRTRESIRHLSSKTGIPVLQLTEVRKGKSRNFTAGTWIHPRLATRFAIWLSDDFGYLVEEWVEEWLLTGQNPVQSSPQTDSFEEEWKRWQQRYDIRIELKDFLRPELMSAVAQWAEQYRKSPVTMCSAVHDAMNERIQGAKAKQIRLMGGLPLAALLRDYFGASPLVAYSAINRLAKNAIQDDGVEPLKAVHDACDRYLGKAYVPKLTPIVENLYKQGQRLKAVRKAKRLSPGQLTLFVQEQAC